jgi:hypothetical protein
LDFLKRVIHGNNARAWLKEVRQQLGEKLDFPLPSASEMYVLAPDPAVKVQSDWH